MKRALFLAVGIICLAVTVHFLVMGLQAMPTLFRLDFSSSDSSRLLLLLLVNFTFCLLFGAVAFFALKRSLLK